MNWLDRYGTDYHKWQLLPVTKSETWYRPIGLVEGMFHKDAAENEGIADMSTLLEAELSSKISVEALRKKIVLAWAVLRFHHVLLSARAICNKDFLSEEDFLPTDRFFVVRKPRDVDEMMEGALRTMNFVGDHHSHVDVEEFYTHVMNTARVFDSSNNMARLFILPLANLPDGRFRFTTISVVAHEIADALSIYRFHAHFLNLLNTPTSALESQAANLCSASTNIQTRLPPAQEDLYPLIPGNKARQRWFWAISRVLRHVRRPPPPCFPNPLSRKRPLKTAVAMPPKYSAVLDYSKTPLLNTYFATAALSKRASARIKSLCRSANVSIGSGAFALVALVMMILYEKQQQQEQSPSTTTTVTNPENHQAPILPFVASFPLNPRAFLTHPTTGQESSLILAFSDGLTLPFLPNTLTPPSRSQLEARFTLLARHAHRQLRVYQKHNPANHPTTEPTTTEILPRPPPPPPPPTPPDSRSATQMLPQLYLYTSEREGRFDVQGQYAVSPNGGGGGSADGSGAGATCGVSSVGEIGAPPAQVFGREDAAAGADEDEECVFSLSGRRLRCTVRARPGEFLVGAMGDERGMGFALSFDGCGLEKGRVDGDGDGDGDGESTWKRLMEGLFDYDDCSCEDERLLQREEEEEEEEREEGSRGGKDLRNGTRSAKL